MPNVCARIDVVQRLFALLDGDDHYAATVCRGPADLRSHGRVDRLANAYDSPLKLVSNVWGMNVWNAENFTIVPHAHEHLAALGGCEGRDFLGEIAYLPWEFTLELDGLTLPALHEQGERLG